MVFLVGSSLQAPQTALAEFPQTLHPRVTILDGEKYVAFPPIEAEALLWTRETQVPQLLAAVAAYDRLDQAQTALIRTATTALAASQSITADQRTLTNLWKDAATATPSLWKTITANPVVWVCVGALAGVGVYKLLKD